MGRKPNFMDPDRPKNKGGRKTRRQQDPIIPRVDDGIVKKRSRNQKLRAIKRAAKLEEEVQKREAHRKLSQEKRVIANLKIKAELEAQKIKSDDSPLKVNIVKDSRNSLAGQTPERVKALQTALKLKQIQSPSKLLNGKAKDSPLKRQIKTENDDESNEEDSSEVESNEEDSNEVESDDEESTDQMTMGKVNLKEESSEGEEESSEEIEDSNEEDENESVEEEESLSEGESDGNVTPGFTDENKLWLKPVSKKKAQNVKENLSGNKEDESSDDSDESDDDDVEEESNLEVAGKKSMGKDLQKSSKKNLKRTLSTLNSDSDESDSDDSDLDRDDFGSKSDDLLPVEKKAKKLREQQEIDKNLAEEELMLNVASHDVFAFPSEEEQSQPKDLIDIQQRIKDVIIVLNDLKNLREEGRSRVEYVDLLRRDLCTYYSYNDFLMEKLMQVFHLSELLEYLEASEVQRPLTIRVNSLKARRRDLAQALINRGVNLDPLGEWTKVGLVVYSSQVPLGATPEYLAGHYIIQGASSLLPVMALAPQENERILDMSAAPGGKASHIAAVMKNTGVLFANDINPNRIKAVIGNFHRLGIVNSVITALDGRKYPNMLQGFDRVMLDAPCTGTGVVSKDPSVKANKDEGDVTQCRNLQQELLLAAIDCLSARSSTGGYVVYSTCSVLVEENEWVIDFVMKRRAVRLVPTGLDFGTEGFTKYRHLKFHPSLKLTRRFYPHTHNMDGFFVAKLQKMSDKIPQTITNSNVNEEEEEYPVDQVEEATVTDSQESRALNRKAHKGKGKEEIKHKSNQGISQGASNSASKDGKSSTKSKSGGNLVLKEKKLLQSKVVQHTQLDGSQSKNTAQEEKRPPTKSKKGNQQTHLKAEKQSKPRKSEKELSQQQIERNLLKEKKILPDHVSPGSQKAKLSKKNEEADSERKSKLNGVKGKRGTVDDKKKMSGSSFKEKDTFVSDVIGGKTSSVLPPKKRKKTEHGAMGWQVSGFE